MTARGFSRLHVKRWGSSVTADIVQPYHTLRNNLHRRDRSLREKVVSLEEAASFVNDGAMVGIGGSTLSRTPMAMIWQLIRARKKNLSCSRCIISTDGDLLIGSGVANHIMSSWFAQGILWGLSKVMRHYVEKELARYDEWSHMAMGMRFRAGGMGVPFLPMRSMLGSDVARIRPEVKEIDCPFTGEKLLLIPALNPDVALIHVQRCDAYGNAQMDGCSSWISISPLPPIASSSPPNGSSRTTRSAARPIRQKFRSSASTLWSRCHTGRCRTNATGFMNRR